MLHDMKQTRTANMSRCIIATEDEASTAPAVYVHVNVALGCSFGLFFVCLLSAGYAMGMGGEDAEWRVEEKEPSRT